MLSLFQFGKARSNMHIMSSSLISVSDIFNWHRIHLNFKRNSFNFSFSSIFIDINSLRIIVRMNLFLIDILETPPHVIRHFLVSNDVYLCVLNASSLYNYRFAFIVFLSCLFSLSVYVFFLKFYLYHA